MVKVIKNNKNDRQKKQDKIIAKVTLEMRLTQVYEFSLIFIHTMFCFGYHQYLYKNGCSFFDIVYVKLCDI